MLWFVFLVMHWCAWRYITQSEVIQHRGQYGASQNASTECWGLLRVTKPRQCLIRSYFSNCAKLVAKLFQNRLWKVLTLKKPGSIMRPTNFVSWSLRHRSYRSEATGCLILYGRAYGSDSRDNNAGTSD